MFSLGEEVDLGTGAAQVPTGTSGEHWGQSFTGTVSSLLPVETRAVVSRSQIEGDRKQIYLGRA